MSRSLTREIARACAVCRDQHAAGDIEAARATARYIRDDVVKLFEQLEIAEPWFDPYQTVNVQMAGGGKLLPIPREEAR